MSAELRGLAGQAVAVGLQVGIGVRLHAELGDEQRQRQQVNDQAATTTSEQGPGLRGASIRRLRARDNGRKQTFARVLMTLMSRFATVRHHSAM